MLLKFFVKGSLWLNFKYVCRKPSKVCLCFCTYNEKNNEHPINKQQTGNSDEFVQVNENSKSQLPEEPTTCCMSGCANCVWLEYAEKLSEYFKDGGESAIKEINEKVHDPNIRAFLLQELRMKKLE